VSDAIYAARRMPPRLLARGGKDLASHGELVRLMVRVDLETMDYLRERAIRDKMPVAEVIRLAIARMEDDDGPRNR